MTTPKPVDPKKRIEILDVLRGFALSGIIFNNILYLSGYSFIPFSNLSRFLNFEINEKIFHFLDIIITAKFYTLFSILFAVGFYLQFSKHREHSIDFLGTYRRRLVILLIIGLIHSLLWFGDILFLYAIIGFILILFRNVKTKNLLRWSLFFILFPILLDFALLLFFQGAEAVGAAKQAALAHITYPDMTPEAVMNTFQNGSIKELFFLNIHHLIWKWLGYIPTGRFVVTLGIFLLGYYLASINFFIEKTKSKFLLLASLIIGFSATISAQLLGGDLYQFPSNLSNILYKILLTIGQISMCLFYIVFIFRIIHTTIGKKILNCLKPVGRMALTNYVLQTVICILIFYNFGFNLICKTELLIGVIIAVSVLLLQIVLSNVWLHYFRFGPLEWVWRSLTYKKIIKIRN